MKLTRLFSAVALASAAVLTLSGCTTISTLIQAYGQKPKPIPTATETTAPSGKVVLELGDCLDRAKLEDGDTKTDPMVKCTKPHDLQVFSAFDIDGKDYPGAAAIVSDAATRCADSFTKFVGVDFGISTLDFIYYYPTETSWSDGDRTVDCAIFDPDGQTTGTLKNANR